MSVVIKAENVSIRYITGDFKDIGLKEFFVKKLKGEYSVTEFWADKDISFQLKKGDMLGIIGTNGAGKSTLLKAVSGIMEPTEGKMTINGSIAALLELASGFDGDLTVRENTYLRGAMLGYTREFMEQMYDQIIEFAELKDFQERPFKQLSSGMKSRLAFSIACLVNPDILILDEVLSVGDGAFRTKSGNKMKEILAGGVTGILVSHSISQVREMCNKILWLDHGKQIAFTDDTELYLDAYEEFLFTKRLPQSIEDVVKLANSYNKRREKEMEIAERSETEKLQAILESGESEAATEAALNIIKKNRPELLKDYQPQADNGVDDKSSTMITNISGGNNLQCSIAVANRIKRKLGINKFENIVLCNENNQLECLLSSNLANFLQAPLLIYNKLNYRDALYYLKNNVTEKNTIYLIGNDSIFSTEIIGCPVINICADNPVELNLEILKYNRNTVKEIFICSSKNIVDNSSVVATGKPFLVVDELLTDHQLKFIKSFDNIHFYILGGNTAVSRFTENQLKELGKVTRLYGKTRYETSVVFAKSYFSEPESVIFVSGMDYPNAFYSGIFAAIQGIPLILADKGGFSVVKDYLTDKNISKITLVGKDSYLSSIMQTDLLSDETDR